MYPIFSYMPLFTPKVSHPPNISTETFSNFMDSPILIFSIRRSRIFKNVVKLIPVPPTSPSASASPVSVCSTPDNSEINVTDCSSGYSSLDESWTTPTPPFQNYPLPYFAYTPPYFPFFNHQWSSPRLATDAQQSPGCEESFRFPMEYKITPLKPLTPVSAGVDDGEVSPMSNEKNIFFTSAPTMALRLLSHRLPTRSKSRCSLMILEIIADLLSNIDNTDINEWISAKSPEFKIRDRKKFAAHWNRLSGRQDSFIAIACKLRGVGNEKMQTTDGQKIRLITRTAPYTYRLLPDHEAPSFPMLQDHILQRLVTKMLLSFHLHQRKCKNAAESAAFPPF